MQVHPHNEQLSVARQIEMVYFVALVAQVSSFARALDEVSGPALAYCRSGTRCCARWAEGAVDDIFVTTNAAAYGLPKLRRSLERCGDA